MPTDQERWDRRLAAERRRKALRERAIAHLGGQCCICAYQGCAGAFDFHHLDPLEKDFTISARFSSWRMIKPELEKCVLLCCRCHREVHDGMHPQYLADPTAERGQSDEDDDFLDVE